MSVAKEIVLGGYLATTNKITFFQLAVYHVKLNYHSMSWGYVVGLLSNCTFTSLCKHHYYLAKNKQSPNTNTLPGLHATSPCAAAPKQGPVPTAKKSVSALMIVGKLHKGLFVYVVETGIHYTVGGGGDHSVIFWALYWKEAN